MPFHYAFLTSDCVLKHNLKSRKHLRSSETSSKHKRLQQLIYGYCCMNLKALLFQLFRHYTQHHEFLQRTYLGGWRTSAPSSSNSPIN